MDCNYNYWTKVKITGSVTSRETSHAPIDNVRSKNEASAGIQPRYLAMARRKPDTTLVDTHFIRNNADQQTICRRHCRPAQQIAFTAVLTGHFTFRSIDRYRLYFQ